MLSVCFWGVRGSIPCPGRTTVEFGGNTACLEIRADERLIIIDMGTGARPLGEYVMRKSSGSDRRDMDIFITHTHWDHIMGFPMFPPIFAPGTSIRMRGPVSYNDDTLASIIGDQLSYRYWPVQQSDLAAHIQYEELKETTIDMGGGLKVTTKYLNHPILCLGYRFEYQGKSIITAYDHEPFRNLFPTNPEDPSYNEEAALEGEAAAKEENEKILRFFNDADVLIHDAQYTAEEFKKHLGWGHSSHEHAIDSARQAGVKKIVLFHHDPSHTDAQLESLEAKYRKEQAHVSSPLEVIIAREGHTIEA